MNEDKDLNEECLDSSSDTDFFAYYVEFMEYCCSRCAAEFLIRFGRVVEQTLYCPNCGERTVARQEGILKFLC